MIEMDLPFSDPLADGPTIQSELHQALHNGMTTQVLFDQLKKFKIDSVNYYGLL
jgi:tryptophan synthase alpha chain